MSDFQWDWDAPVTRVKGETTKAFEALQDYIDMGPGRSLGKLEERYNDPLLYPEAAPPEPPTKYLRTLKRWSSRYEWQARLARYLDIEAEKREERRQRRREELEDADWEYGKALREKAREFIDELSRFKQRRVQTIQEDDGTEVRIVTVELDASIAELARALKTASDLQRLSTNEPTDNIDIRGSALLSEIMREMDNLNPPGESSADRESLDESAEETT